MSLLFLVQRLAPILILLLRISVCALGSPDVSALVQLASAWNSKLDWQGTDPCGWTGVSCEGDKIVALVLNNMRLNGTLSPAIGRLTDLKTLDLSFNPSLRGAIPDTLGSLLDLQVLNLQKCGFSGKIPSELGQLSKLVFLALNYNGLEGEIPSTLGNLKALEWCDLSHNSLSAPLPVSSTAGIGLDNMTAVQHLHLHDNRLSGSLPGELSTLPALVHLLLNGNRFSGSIPEEFGNFSRLEILKLDDNWLQGAIPNALARLASLNELHLSKNWFQVSNNGTLPNFKALRNLLLLRASNINSKTAAFPDWILELPNLKTLEMRHNNLAGVFPSKVLSLPNLEAIYLESNELSGTIDFSTAAKALTRVFLDNNNITTLLFPSGNVTLSLKGNPLCAKGSSEFCNQLEQLWQPIFKPCEQQCDGMKTLLPSTCSCAYPLITTIQFVSPPFSVLTLERVLSAKQQFSSGLNISADQIWIGSAEFTDDHQILMNILFFPSPNVTYLTPGMVSSILSLLSTCMVKLPEFGPFLLASTNQPETASVREVKQEKQNSHLLIILVIAIVLLVCVSTICFCLMRRKRKATKQVAPSRPPEHYGTASGISSRVKRCRWFTLAELRIASDCFDGRNLIGAGGYGEVYKGKLPTGDYVAIKRARDESIQGLGEFRNEIELLSRVHHKNLVNLVGFCTDNGEQILVYEYMPNRTLRDHLQEHSEALDWKTRLEIALGSAKGLEYLHEMANPPIIHRDIKSSNILLDADFVAKVADFGLSKLAPDDGKAYTITQVKGTLGYLDPEYYVYQRLSEKSDVYSFGVMLIELVTGRQPIDKGRFIVKEVKESYSSGGVSALHSYLDPRLMGQYDAEEMDKLLELASHCIEGAGSRRPSMNELVKRLEVLVTGGSISSSSSSGSSSRRAFISSRREESAAYDGFDAASNNSFQRMDEVCILEPSLAKFSFASNDAADDDDDFSFKTESVMYSCST